MMSALHIQIYTAVAPRLVKCNNHSTPTHKLIFLSLSVFKCEQNSENKESGGLIRGESFMGEWSLWRKSKLRRIDGKSQMPSQGPATKRPQVQFGGNVEWTGRQCRLPGWRLVEGMGIISSIIRALMFCNLQSAFFDLFHSVLIVISIRQQTVLFSYFINWRWGI